MTQTRYYFSAARDEAHAQYRKLEAAFDEQGWPLAIVEIDESKRIFEVSVYSDAEETAAEIAAALGADGPTVSAEALPEIDWVTHTLQGLPPVRAGRFVVHGAHDRNRVRTGDIGIEIEAGQAFGTGHHGTTSGCLDVLARVARNERPRNALDLGTGSAVLAIGLAKMARVPVLATDIDPVATVVATANIRLNHVSSLVHAVTATGFHHPALRTWAPFDLIIANILARPLMRLAPEMAVHLAPGGSIVLSGILESQRNAVISAYVGQRFRHISTLRREGWVTLHLKR